MTTSLKKYRIDELLKSLSIAEHQKALRVIPAEIEVSSATFQNYRKIKVTDAQDIPHEKVVALEKIFNIPAGSLLNTDVQARPLSKIKEKNESSDLAEKFNLKGGKKK